MNNTAKILLFIAAIAFGVFMVVFGGMDDSPGAQFLGLLGVVGGVAGLWKSRKKRS